jgi:WD40 repeat protein
VLAEIEPSGCLISRRRRYSFIHLIIHLAYGHPPFTRHLVRTISGHSEWVRCVVPSDDGKYLASGSKDHVSEFCLAILFDAYLPQT